MSDNFQDRNSRFINFQIGQQEFGLDISSVKEIINPTLITQLPDSADIIKGVINLRGDVIPVIDMHKMIGSNGLDKRNDYRVIIIENNGHMAGLLVDGVNEVTEYAQEDLVLLDENKNILNSELFSHLIKLEDKLIPLIRIEQVLIRESTKV